MQRARDYLYARLHSVPEVEPLSLIRLSPVLLIVPLATFQPMESPVRVELDRRRVAPPVTPLINLLSFI
jgi:hypothetical protein